MKATAAKINEDVGSRKRRRGLLKLTAPLVLVAVGVAGCGSTDHTGGTARPGVIAATPTTARPAHTVTVPPTRYPVCSGWCAVSPGSGPVHWDTLPADPK